jgi:hypothetical protein
MPKEFNLSAMDLGDTSKTCRWSDFVGAHPVGDGRVPVLQTIAHGVGSYKPRFIRSSSHLETQHVPLH